MIKCIWIQALVIVRMKFYFEINIFWSIANLKVWRILIVLCAIIHKIAFIIFNIRWSNCYFILIFNNIHISPKCVLMINFKSKRYRWSRNASLIIKAFEYVVICVTLIVKQSINLILPLIGRREVCSLSSFLIKAKLVHRYIFKLLTYFLLNLYHFTFAP